MRFFSRARGSGFFRAPDQQLGWPGKRICWPLAMVQHSRKALCPSAGDLRPQRQRAGADHVQPIAGALLLHPVAFIGIVAGAEIDKGDVVVVDHLLEQGGAERGAGGEGAGVLGVGELVDEGGAAFDSPQLGGDGAPICTRACSREFPRACSREFPRDTKAQATGGGFLFGEAFEEGGAGFAGLPAVGVDLFVGGPSLLFRVVRSGPGRVARYSA